jgi:DNA modification methylase
MIKPYYEHGGITIYNADCREVLPELGRFDLLLTDPPYGIGEARNNNQSRSCIAASKDYGMSSWDDSPVDVDTLRQLQEIAEWQAIFGGNYYPMPPSSCWLVWDKDNGANDFADCELAWTNFPKAVRLLKHKWQGMLQENMKDKEYRFHPTQKPVPVMQWCIGHAPKANTILDPFMGSGTTLVAAKNLGRTAVGIELEEKYCEIAALRLSQEVMDFGVSA